MTDLSKQGKSILLATQTNEQRQEERGSPAQRRS